MNRSAFQYLAFLTLFALSGEALAAPVVIRDDGPNGPLGSCVLPEGHWEITFTKTYAVKLSANGSGTSSADVLYGDLLVDITCDGTVKILEIEPTTARESHFEYVYPRQPDAPYGFPYPPTSASTDIVPVTYREVRALRDGQGGNPLIELDVVLGEKSLHWRWQVTEVSERTGHSLIGRAPWTQDSLAASRPDAPIDPPWPRKDSTVGSLIKSCTPSRAEIRSRLRLTGIPAIRRPPAGPRSPRELWMSSGLSRRVGAFHLRYPSPRLKAADQPRASFLPAITIWR